MYQFKGGAFQNAETKTYNCPRNITVTDVLSWQKIDGTICLQSDGNIDRDKGEAFSFPFI